MLVRRYLLPSVAKSNKPEHALQQLAIGAENATRWTELENAVDQLREQLRSHTDRSLATQESHHAMVSKLTEEFVRQQANNEALQKDKRTAHLALNRLATERRALSAQLDAALAHTQRLDLDKRQLATELESSHQHLQSAQKQLDAALANVERLDLERRQLTSELETSRKQLQDSETESTQLRTRLDELEKTCDTQCERIRIHEQHRRRDSDKIEVLQRKSRDLTDQLEFHERGLSSAVTAPAPPTPVSSPQSPSRRAQWSRSSSSGLLPTSPSASSTISPRLRRTLSLVNAHEGQQRGITTPITDYDELVSEYESLQLDCDSLEQLARDVGNQFLEEQRRCENLQAEVKALRTENRELSSKAEQLTEQLADVQEELAIYRDSATASTEAAAMSSAETTSSADSATASSANADPHSDERVAPDLALSDSRSTHTDQKDDCLEIEKECEEDDDNTKVAKSYLRRLRTAKESLRDIRTADSVHELIRSLEIYENGEV